MADTRKGPGDLEIPDQGLEFLDLPRPIYNGGPLFTDEELARMGLKSDRPSRPAVEGREPADPPD